MDLGIRAWNSFLSLLKTISLFSLFQDHLQCREKVKQAFSVLENLLIQQDEKKCISYLRQENNKKTTNTIKNKNSKKKDKKFSIKPLIKNQAQKPLTTSESHTSNISKGDKVRIFPKNHHKQSKIINVHALIMKK